MTQQPEQSAPGITYAAAGVDTAAGDRAVALMKDAVASTMTPAVVGGVGGFAGLVDVSVLRDYRRPLLATSTDGVGTKVTRNRAHSFDSQMCALRRCASWFEGILWFR